MSASSSPASNKSPPDSPRSNRSNSSNSRSPSIQSEKSPVSHRSRSKSRSQSKSKSRSRSVSRSKSKSRSKSRSGSRSVSQSKSRSISKSRSRSRSKSQSKSRSRSGSVVSNRSSHSARSSDSGHSRRSKRSRSGSADSKGSKRSGSVSNKSSYSGSGTPRSNRSRSYSRSRSRSGSRNLEIDEASDHEGNHKSDNEQPDDKKAQKKDVSAAAIFGDDADDISDDSEAGKSKQGDDDARRSRSRSISMNRSRSRSRSRSNHSAERLSGDEDNQKQTDDEEKEPEPEPIPETRIDVEVPKIMCDLGRDIHFVKLPNFLSVETRPFDAETYEDEIDEEETLDEEGRARLKLKVENTIRWRDVIDQGTIKKESNARIVRWSDGSYSLHLGSEIFDIYKQPLQGDHNHLFIRQGTGLQGQAVFRTKLSFRPHSTESFTHRKMTLSLADRSQKTSGIKILSQVGVDPDNDRAIRLKKEEEKLKQSTRSKAHRTRKLDMTSRARHSYREDGSDDEGGISLNAIKNKYKSGGASAHKGAIYSSDDDDSDFESRRSRKSDKSKALKDSDEESDKD